MIPIPKQYLQLDDEELWNFCQEMAPYRIERDGAGQIFVAEPTGTYTGGFNAEVTTEIGLWNRKTKQGKGFDSSTGFKLPDSSVRSPDSSWIALERWLKIPEAERQVFAAITPDFVAEIMSRNDSLTVLQQKMEQYIQNGVRLGWLIEPAQQQAWIYRIDGSVEHRDSFEQPLLGEDVLVGFELRVNELVE